MILPKEDFNAKHAQPTVAEQDAFYESVCTGDLAAVKGFLSQYSYLSLGRRHSDGCTIFTAAASFDQHEIIRLLLDHGVDIDQRDENNYTALLWACGDGNVRTVALLLEKGAALSSYNKCKFLAGQYPDIIALLEKEPERRRHVKLKEALKVFTEGLQKGLRTPKSPFKKFPQRPS